MTQPKIQGNFSGGELSPDLWGHVDLARYASAASTVRNLFVNYRGGLFSRAGTAFIGRCKQNPPTPPRDIPFQFSLNQSYALEFGEHYMRVKTQGQYLLEPNITITGATQANPCEITAPGNILVDNDWVVINFVTGMTELNGNTYIVQNSNTGAGTFTLDDLDGNPIDATAYHAYVSGGGVRRVFTLETPYAAADLQYLKYAQSADIVSLTCVNVGSGTEYPPYELSRLGSTDWTIEPLSLGAPIDAPTTVTTSASNNPDSGSTPPTQPCAYAYVVTAVDPTTGSESNPSPRGNVTDTIDMGVTAGSVTVTWDAVPGATRYNVYRTAPGYNTKSGDTSNALPVPAGAQFFYAGSSYGNQFVDTNIVTDANRTPPLHLDPFAPGQVPSVTMTDSNTDWTTCAVSISSTTGAGWEGEAVIVPQGTGAVVAVIVKNPGQGYTNSDSLVFTGDGTGAVGTLNLGPASGTYPATVAYFQQRRIYAQSLNLPDTYWASQTGLFTDFDSGDPPIDTDAITASPFSQTVNGIQWLVPMPGGLVALTGSGAWQITGAGGGALSASPITPSSEQAQPQAFNGVHDRVPPIRINYDILYVESRGSFIRDMNYNIYFNIYNTADVSWPSVHLFNGHQIQQWAWCEEPYKLVWAAREDGALLSLTYIKEQEVAGWARHDTQGLVRSVCAVTEPSPENKLYLSPVDALYMIVERYVQNRWLYFSERMNDRLWNTVEDCWCVDCGLSTLTSDAFPNATLTISDATGDNVLFTSSSDVFDVNNTGGTLRAGGGIAVITSYISATQVQGQWIRPLVNTIPNDPDNTPVPAAPLTWSLLSQSTSVSGLAHLAGKQVVGLADGAPIGPLTVAADGTVALPFTASLVTLGLPFLPQFQSLYLDNGQPTLQGRRKSIGPVTVRVVNSGYPYVLTNQPDGSALDPPQIAPTWLAGSKAVPTPAGADPQRSPDYKNLFGQTVVPLATGDLYANVASTWRKTGQVAVQQPSPLPLNITAVVPNFLEGDVADVAVPPRQKQRQAA